MEKKRDGEGEREMQCYFCKSDKKDKKKSKNIEYKIKTEIPMLNNKVKETWRKKKEIERYAVSFWWIRQNINKDR